MIAAAPRALLAALVLATAACAGDGDGDDGVAATTTGPAGAETTSSAPGPAATAAAGATTTSTEPPVACAGEPLAAEVDEASSVQADVDGDGAADLVTGALATDGWHLRVDLAAGGVLDELLPTAPLDAARPLAAVDLDGDGDDELWVQVGTGAATTIVGLYLADGCDLEAALLDGRPVELAVGGTVTLLGGVACGDGGVTLLTATSEDGAAYTTLDLTYELRDGALVRTGEEAGQLQATDPDLAQYADFSC